MESLVKTSWRTVANSGVAFGLGVSTWANVARSWDHGWGARLMAAVWPTIVYLAIEVLARTPWGGRVGKWVARFAALVVGLVAAYVSYQHLHGLMLSYGYDATSATVGPLGIDGVMVICAAALLNRPTEDTTPDAVTEVQPEPKPVVIPKPAATAAPAPAKRAAPKRRINGSDLREVEVVKLIRAARAAGEPDPNANQVANHIGAKWETGDKLLKKALAQVGERP